MESKWKETFGNRPGEKAELAFIKISLTVISLSLATS
jgi:hypothetical protein